MVSIGEFSRISNVTVKTLRYYDEIGLLKPAQVNRGTGYRYYTVEQLKSILFINRLKRYGFSLEEIARVSAAPYDDSLLRTLIRQKRQLLQEQLQAQHMVLGQLEQDLQNLERGITIMAYYDEIPVKLVDRAPMNILFTRQKLDVSEYGKYIGKLYERIAREKLTPQGPPMSIFHDEAFDPANYDMEIAVPVQDVVKGTRELQGGLCAMATLRGPYSELPAIYAKIQEWMEAEGYTIANPPYELYITDPGSTAPENFVTEVYVPARKA